MSYNPLVRLTRTIIAAGLLLLPAAAFGMQEIEWDFRGGQVVGEWSMSGFSEPQAGREGLLLRAESRATMLRETRLPFAAQVVRFTVTSLQPMEAVMLWHPRGEPEGTYVQLPFVIPGNGFPTAVDVNAEAYPQWDGDPDAFGFAVPAGAELILHDIRFARWSLPERIIEAWRGFWTFDRLTPYSINFLWGPLLTFNPVATRELFATLPPRGRSANWVFFGAAAITGAALFAHRSFRKGTGADTRLLDRLRFGDASPHLVAFFLIVGALWFAYDLRMGAEFLSYAKTDAEYLSKARGHRSFRSYAYLTDLALDAAEAARGDSRIAVIEHGTPIVAMLRYAAYPAIPTKTEEPSDVKTWAVVDRFDVTVEEGKIALDGKYLSGEGEIIRRYDEGSFVFRVSTP